MSQYTSTTAAIDEIRNNFPFGMDQDSEVYRVYRMLRDPKHQDLSTILLKVAADGSVIGTLPAAVLDDDSSGVRAVPGTGGSGRVDARINGLLEGLRAALAAGGEKLLVVHAGTMFSSRRSARRVELAQLGFIFTGRVQSTHDAALPMLAEELATLSNFAALTLLYERERYYEKSLRQAVRGGIVKADHVTQVRLQVTRLQTLETQGQHFVPEVLETDPDLAVETDLSWFAMGRFDLRSLSDIVTATKGLRDYEVRGVLHACIEHLRETYWGTRPLSEVSDGSMSIVAACVLTHDVVNAASNRFLREFAHIVQGRPVKLRNRVEVFETPEFAAFAEVIRTCNVDHAPFDIQAFDGSVTRCQSSGTVTRRLLDCVWEVEPFNCWRCKVHYLHGDANFGNLLVDASIPEDPLVVSIDQQDISYAAPEDMLRFETHITLGHRRNDLLKELVHFAVDPTVDFAKLLLSSVGGYGIVKRNAIGFAVEGDDAVRRVRLTRQMDWRPAPMRVKDGISGAQLIELDANVPEEAFRYHTVAGRQTLVEFLRLLRNAGVVEAGDVNVALIRLWLLTIRHVFSTAGMLFPKDGQPAVVLYLIGTLLLNRGLIVVTECVKQGFRVASEELATQLFPLTLGE